MNKLQSIIKDATDPSNLNNISRRRFITSHIWRERAKKLSPILSPEKTDVKEFYRMVNNYLGEEVIDLEKIRTKRKHKTTNLVEKHKELFPILDLPKKEEKKQFKYQKIHESAPQVFLPDYLVNYSNTDRKTLNERLTLLEKMRDKTQLQRKNLSDTEKKHLDYLIAKEYLSHYMIPKKKKNRIVKGMGAGIGLLGVLPTLYGLFRGTLPLIIGGGISTIVGAVLFQWIDVERGPFHSIEYRLDPSINTLLDKLLARSVTTPKTILSHPPSKNI